MAIQHKDIAAIREEYTKGVLFERDVDSNPIIQFQNWFQQALNAEVMEPNAMVLATISQEGYPTSRVVLMKDISTDGITFFTNYLSEKGHDIERNSKISILFFWPELQRQVRIEANAERLNESDSIEYFQSRPKSSQIGAWSSPQSQVIDSRDLLEERVIFYTNEYKDAVVLPKPDFWGGYLLRPVRFEFWQGRASRLHDRIQYIVEDDVWVINRLAP